MEPDISAIFIKNVNRILKEKSLKKKDLAERLNVKPPVVIKILTEGTNPKLDTMIAVARALQVPFQSLITDPLSTSFEILTKLTSELREIEKLKSEKRIEIDIWHQKYIEAKTDKMREEFLAAHPGKLGLERYKNTLNDIKRRASSLNEEIEDLEYRERAIPLEIQRLESQINPDYTPKKKS